MQSSSEIRRSEEAHIPRIGGLIFLDDRNDLLSKASKERGRPVRRDLGTTLTWAPRLVKLGSEIPHPRKLKGISLATGDLEYEDDEGDLEGGFE